VEAVLVHTDARRFRGGGKARERAVKAEESGERRKR
jgi:hypothetical protein